MNTKKKTRVQCLATVNGSLEFSYVLLSITRTYEGFQERVLFLTMRKDFRSQG